MKEEEMSLPGELEKFQQADEDEIQGAYICSRETFIELYQLEKRRSLRENIPRCLAHLHLAGELDDELLQTLEEQLLKIIARELRTGDLACRWKESHLVLLLPGTSEENASRVLERLEKKFCQQYDLPKELELEKQVQKFEDLAT